MKQSIKYKEGSKGRNNIFPFFLLILIIIFQTGCKKLVETDAPFMSINAANIYTNDATAASVLTGIYTTLSKSNSSEFNTGGFSSLSLFTSLSADELELFDLNNLVYSNYYSNSLTSIPPGGTANYWASVYPVIYLSNAALNGLNNSTGLTPAVKQQLTGEAKFIRAFCYFYLVNLYGDVPLAVSTDWKINAALTRTPQAQVYLQIINDLKDAQNLLSDKYLQSDAVTAYASGVEARVRPTKWAATALLARTYLYTSDWANAEAEATKVISNSTQYSIVILGNTFLKNNQEAIWQLQAIGSGNSSNTGEGQRFILPATGPSVAYPVFLSNHLLNSFEAGDQRAIPGNWIDSVIYEVSSTDFDTAYYPYKYKIGAVNTSALEYCTVLRLAEQYIVRAEARAQQNNSSGSQSDLNIIRSRAGLGPTIANDKTSLLTAIMQERKSELFTEWGHRWFDLKRTNTIDAVMSIVTPSKNGTWESTDQLYPIPQTELSNAPQLTQNQGY